MIQILTKAISAAARSTERTCPQSEHVELQIYGAGWPSNDDVAGCRAFHESPWETRLDIALGLMDLRFRRLGRRLVYVERPDLLRPADRNVMDDEVARRLRGGDEGQPWLTLPQASAEIDELIAGTPPQNQESLLRLRAEMLGMNSWPIGPA